MGKGIRGECPIIYLHQTYCPQISERGDKERERTWLSITRLVNPMGKFEEAYRYRHSLWVTTRYDIGGSVPLGLSVLFFPGHTCNVISATLTVQHVETSIFWFSLFGTVSETFNPYLYMTVTFVTGYYVGR